MARRSWWYPAQLPTSEALAIHPPPIRVRICLKVSEAYQQSRHGVRGEADRPIVANIVKAYAERAGFDVNLFSGHSLRSGFLTSAAANGASIFKMMDVSRHKSVDTLRGYVRDAELFKDHAGAGLL
jgi:integrase